MKKIGFFFIIFSFFLQAQNDYKFKRLGIIPYQFLSRSTGLYASYDFKYFSVEYRPTYTIPMNKVFYFQQRAEEWYYYNGVNNQVIFYTPGSKHRLGLLLGYRYWWFNTKKVEDRNESGKSGSDIRYDVEKSKMNGFCIGLEGCYSNKGNENKHFDFAFFYNFSITVFSCTTTNYGISSEYGYVFPNINPQTYHFSSTSFNIALGFKFGYRKSISPVN